MCGHFNENGFLLGEALIALSLLVIGLFTVTEAIRTAYRVTEREERNTRLAACGEEWLIRLASQAPLEAHPDCASFKWTETRTPFSPLLDRIQIKVEQAQEEGFETVTLAK